MTRPAAGRDTPTMRYLIAALTLLPTLGLADIAGPAGVIDGDTIEIKGVAAAEMPSKIASSKPLAAGPEKVRRQRAR